MTKKTSHVNGNSYKYNENPAIVSLTKNQPHWRQFLQSPNENLAITSLIKKISDSGDNSYKILLENLAIVSLIKKNDNGSNYYKIQSVNFQYTWNKN